MFLVSHQMALCMLDRYDPVMQIQSDFYYSINCCYGQAAYSIRQFFWYLAACV